MMIHDDTRQTIKFILGVIVIIILLFLINVGIFYAGGSQSRGNDRQVAQLATTKSPIRVIQNYYHLDRGTSSYSLSGLNAKGQKYYFIYLPNSKKAYLYAAKRGVGAGTIRSKFKAAHPAATINQINLGWYQGQAVWEVAYKKTNGNLGYTLYEFKSGNDISEVDNL